MKICHVALQHKNSYDTRIYHRESLTLLKDNHEITILTFSKDDKKETKNFIDENDINHIVIKKEKNISHIYKIYKLLLQINADIYIFHEFDYALLIPFLSKKNKICFYDIHENNQMLFSGFHSKWIKFIENIACKYAKKIFIVVENQKDFYKKYKEKISLIPNYYITSHNSTNHYFHDIKNVSPDIIYAGNINNKDRNLGFYLETGKFLKKLKPDFKFYLVGYFSSKEDEKLYYKKIKEYHLEKNFFTTGRVPYPKLLQYVEQSKIGIIIFQPAYNTINGLPNKLLEYMGKGIAVIGNDFGYIKQIIEKSHCGLIANHNNPKELANKIYDLLNDDNKLKLFKKNSLKAINEKYSWNRFENIFLDIFKKYDKEV